MKLTTVKLQAKIIEVFIENRLIEGVGESPWISSMLAFELTDFGRKFRAYGTCCSIMEMMYQDGLMNRLDVRFRKYWQLKPLEVISEFGSNDLLAIIWPEAGDFPVICQAALRVQLRADCQYEAKHMSSQAYIPNENFDQAESQEDDGGVRMIQLLLPGIQSCGGGGGFLGAAVKDSEAANGVSLSLTETRAIDPCHCSKNTFLEMPSGEGFT